MGSTLSSTCAWPEAQGQTELDVFQDASPKTLQEVSLPPQVGAAAPEKEVVPAQVEQEAPTQKEEPSVVLNAEQKDENANAEASPTAEGGEPFQDRMYKQVQAKVGGRPEPDVVGKMARRPSSENITFDAYTAKHKALFDKVLELEKPDGWILKKELEGVKIYVKGMPGQRFLYFKAVSDFESDGGVGKLMQQIFKTEDRPKWDEMCITGETPQMFPPFYKYAYVQMKSPAGIISQRDLLTMGRFRFEADGTCVAALQSTDLPEFPERTDFVRATFLEGGYVFRPKNGSTYQITWTGCVDPGGWLPTWVVNIAVARQGMTLAKIKKFM